MGAGSGSLLTAVIAIGASFVTILILTYRNKVLSSLTTIEEPKYSVLVPPYTNGNITSAYISKVGIRSFNNAAEFGPIEIGIVNITKATATPSESSGNETPFIPPYISLQVHVCKAIFYNCPSVKIVKHDLSYLIYNH